MSTIPTRDLCVCSWHTGAKAKLRNWPSSALSISGRVRGPAIGSQHSMYKISMTSNQTNAALHAIETIQVASQHTMMTLYAGEEVAEGE